MKKVEGYKKKGHSGKSEEFQQWLVPRAPWTPKGTPPKMRPNLP